MARVTVAALAFLVAFAVDVATGRRFSQLLGGAAILMSALALVPALRRLALPIASWVGIWVGFNALRAIGDAVPWAPATQTLVANAEVWLLGASPSGSLQQALDLQGGMQPHDWAAVAVHLSFFIVPHGIAAVVLLRNRRLFGRYARATLVLLATGAVAFAMVPTAPPWLAGGSTVRLVNEPLAGAGIVAGGQGTGDLGFEPNALAAMPSIHLGATALIAALAFSTRRFRTSALVYVAAMGLALVYLGEHHVLDVVAGAALTGVSWSLVGRDRWSSPS